MFGKNITITDNADWTTTEIVEASLDRWQVEDRFRLSKDDDLVGIQPIRHWTDSKIRCHLFTCIVAMVFLRRLELRLAAAGALHEDPIRSPIGPWALRDQRWGLTTAAALNPCQMGLHDQTKLLSLKLLSVICF